MRVKDDRGCALDLPRLPARVVSLVPSVTETLAAFGLGDRLVGVTDWCTDPPDRVARAARVGHVVAPDPARVSALRPDLIVANAEENRPQAIRKLEADGLPVYVSFPRSVHDAVEGMAALAKLTGTTEAAGPFLEDARSALVEARREAARRPAVPYVCAVWKQPWMTASDDTYLADLLRVTGGLNVFRAAARRYPRTTRGAIVKRRPRLALLPTEPYAFSERDREEFQRAAPSIETVLVDGKLLTWHGIRTAPALRAFARLFAGERSAASTGRS
jgi:ABC-type Fe3+-hydroxamate transport system substrate-binding protein